MAYPDAVYYDVKKDSEKLTAMLQLSEGVRQVPVVVENDRVQVGFGGT